MMLNFWLYIGYTQFTCEYAQMNECQVDFAMTTGPVREYINQWVADATDGQIKDFFQPTDITSQTALAIVSAIYFEVMKPYWSLSMKSICYAVLGKLSSGTYHYKKTHHPGHSSFAYTDPYINILSFSQGTSGNISVNTTPYSNKRRISSTFD